MKSMNRDVAATEQEMMMRRGLGMMSGSFSMIGKLALVAVMALVMMATGMVGQAQAVAVKYAIDTTGGTANVASGISYNYGACGDQTAGSNTNLVKNSDGSCDDRVELTSPGVFFNAYYNTAYAANTQVSGQASGNRFTVRERDSNTATLIFELFYVTAAGNETSLGTYNYNVAADFDDEIEPNLSALGGVVPAGAKLGYRFSYTGNSRQIRVYFGPSNGRTTYSNGTTGWITVDESVACSDTNGSAITLTNPINAATVSGSVSLAANLNNAATAEYSIAGGPWTSIATPWNTLTTYPGSASAPVNNVTVAVRAIEDECGGYVTDTVTVTVNNACTESTPSSIIWNGTSGVAGDFAGSTFATLTDIGTAEYKITESGGGAGVITKINEWTDRLGGSNAALSAGTDRLMVVAADYEYGSDPGQVTVTATCNGKTFTPLVNANGREYVWIGYLTDADAASCAGNPIAVDFADGTDSGGAAEGIWQASFAGVDQTSPLVDSQFSYNSGATTRTFTNLNVEAGGWAMYAFGMNGETHTPATNFTERWDQQTSGASWAGADRSTPTTTTISGTATASTSTRVVLGIASIRPAAGGEATLIDWTSDPLSPAASAVLTNGNSYNIYARGNDTECGTMYYGDPTNPNTTADGIAQGFTWSSCIETATLTLSPITDPITGDITVTASGTASGITVGTTPAAGNASGWIYVPAQDDNTTVVSFYATGTGSCGTLTDSQLNVTTNTMVAPIITGFVAEDTIDTAAPLDINISTFTATDNVAVTGYMITESATPPAAGAAGWLGTAPTTYTVGSYNTYTLFAWTKDAAGNVSSGVSSTATISNCVEAGTVSVSISPDPGAGDITGATTVTANLGGGASNGMVRWRNNNNLWTTWVATGAVYTPIDSRFGTIDFEAMADGSCGVSSPIYSTTLARTYDTRVDALEPTTYSPAQNGVDAILVHMGYHNDKNSTGTFLVEYKLASATSWTTPANMPTTDGGTGDIDGARDEEIFVNLSGLTSGETYDIRMTFADATDGLIGAAEYIVQVTLVSWADNPMLHNSNRFTGTTKHTGNWGKPGDYAGGIQCSTCHEKAPANGNIKRIKAAISFPDGTTMPGGGNSAPVSLLTVEDGSSDFGDDSAAPRSSSNKVCEACHTYDAAQSVGVKQHAANQSVQASHYDNSDCIKCHLHNAGFKADCTTCHANPPITAGGLDSSVGTGSTTAGLHDYHVNTKGYGCNTCHTGWEGTGEMPKNGNINLGFNIVLGSTTDTTGAYDGRSTGGGYTAAAGTSVTTGNGLSCSAIYCHGSAAPAWSDVGTAVCGSCHGDTNGMPSANAGDGDLSGATSGSQVGKHPEHVINAGLACATCHKDLGFGTPDHVNGTVDIWFDTALAGASATYTNATNTCSNLSCHISKVWDTATPASCDMCHGYPPTPTTLHASGATPVDHSATNIVGKHSECNLCHGYSQANGATDNTANGGDAYQVSYHRDGNIEMNGISAPDNGQSAQYDSTTAGCAKACHANDATHQLSNSGFPVQLHEYGSGSCTGCHDGSGAAGTALSISDTSSHALTATGLNCEDCHGSHGGGTIEIPNNPAVGINYTANGETGIALGVATTAPGATEAEICWNCHAGAGVSEWGANTNANTGSSAFNYGTLNQSNWVGATWTSGTAKFSYKTGTIQSTHSVNSSVTAPGVDAVGDIRCSYCHDVHDVNAATGDALSGAPYLRGTWMGNPYREDGAPQAGDSWANQNDYGAVPRGGPTYTEQGGYQIDQNNGNPTNGWTANSSAGLCELCHGNGDGNFTATEIDSLNQFGTASTDWVGTNGHSAAVLGGGDSVAANIFTVSDRNTTAPNFNGGNGTDAGNPAMGNTNHASGDEVYSFRSFESDGYSLNPKVADNRSKIVASYNWGANTNTALDSDFHNFSCSKCHNPHASRLPRLMITNCLDTRHNTWDDQYNSLPSAGATNGDGSGSVSTDNANKTLSQATSAQNCHRVGDSSQSGTGAGWNNVTPW